MRYFLFCNYTGIKEVDPSLIEAAKGIGMKPLRRLTKVELPIAMPVIMAGIRTAMVLIIGTATLAGFNRRWWSRRFNIIRHRS